MAILVGIQQVGPIGLASKTYTLNSIEAFRRRGSSMNAQPDTHRGFAWYQPHSSFTEGSLSREQVLSQLDGIKKFASSGDGSEGSELQSTLALTLVGEKNIQNFIDGISSVTKSRGSAESMALFIARANLGAFSLVTTFSALAADPAVINLTLALVHLLAAEPAVQEFMARQHGFERAIRKLQATAKSRELGGWVLVSSHANLDQVLSESISTKNSDQVIEDYKHQFDSEVVTVLDKLLGLGSKSRQDRENSDWVGVDLLLDHHHAEPELHIVIRRAKSRPKFPLIEMKNEKREQDRASVILPSLSNLGAPVHPK